MASWRSLFAVAAFLPGVAGAADPAMLELIMPDARVVMEVNLDHIVASPLGQAMSPQMKADLLSLRTSAQDSLPGLGTLDWSRYAREVVFAAGAPDGPGKPLPSLIIVRGLLDPALIESLNTFSGVKSSYLGIPILSSANGNSAVAFLDGSIAVIGQSSDVKAAIRRRGQNTPPSPVLAEGLARYEGQCDAWLVSAGSLAAPAKTPIASLKWLERLDSFTGGVRFGPDFELSAEMRARNEKDVAGMAGELRWFAGVVQTQEKTALSLEDMNFQVEGTRLSLSLQVPEQEIRAALQQRDSGSHPRTPRTAAVRPPDTGNGLPEPPSGTIRVQSSPADMGTVLLPVGKAQ